MKTMTKFDTRHFGVWAILGLLQMIYFGLMVLTTNWKAVSDPMAHTFLVNLIFPSSVLLFLVSLVCGRIYHLRNCRIAINIGILASAILSALFSVVMLKESLINPSDLLKYIAALFVMISPFCILAGILIGKLFSLKGKV